MNIYLIGDYSQYHAGCKAVQNELHRKIRLNHTIIKAPAGLPASVDVKGLKNADALVVNGEGSIHHDALRCYHIFDWIKTAQKLGKKTYLVNTIWQAMGEQFDSVLAKIDRITVRETLSQQEMKKCGVTPQVFLDVSYWHPVEETPFKDFEKSIVVGDFLETIPPPEKIVAAYACKLPLQNVDWPYLVNSLKTASLYITGRHHGVYAACKAKTPFVAYQTNSHKIKGLIAGSGLEIPIAKTQREMEKLIPWALANTKIYQELFTWMDAQPEWSFDV